MKDYSQFIKYNVSGKTPHLQSFANLNSGYDWAINEDVCGIQVQVNGANLLDGWSITGHHTARCGEQIINTMLLSNENGLLLKYITKSFKDCSVVEMKCSLENRSSQVIPITSLSPVNFTFKGSENLKSHTIRKDVYAMQSNTLESLLEIKGGNWNAPENAGWLVLENKDMAECLFLGIQWEREWILSIAPNDNKVKITLNLDRYTHDLKQGDMIESPVVFMGTMGGDLDDATNAMRRYMQKHVLPIPVKDFPWIAYDIWSTESEKVEEILMEEVDFASKMGVEIFYIDSSWWQDSSIKSDGAWGYRLGNYTEDIRKFPNGIRAFSDYVHSKGMKFGLWVDPMIIDEHWVALGTIPDKWLVKENGNPAVLDLTELSGWPRVNQICTGCSEVTEYIFAKLCAIIDEYRLDWIKWDDSAFSHPICTRDDHGHQAGDGNYAAVAGKYQIFKRLHESYPMLVMEACGYPARIDYGLAPYIRTSWLSDSSSPAEKVINNMEFASYVYPNSYNSAWLVEHDEVLKESNPVVLDTVVRSRMMGLFGFGTITGHLSERISLWPKPIHDAIKRNVPHYKAFRHLLSQDVYHYNENTCTNINGWRIMSCVSYDKDESIVFLFRSGSEKPSDYVKVRGLDENATYCIGSLNTEETKIMSAKDLVTDGVFVDLSKHTDSSDIITMKKV